MYALYCSNPYGPQADVRLYDTETEAKVAYDHAERTCSAAHNVCQVIDQRARRVVPQYGPESLVVRLGEWLDANYHQVQTALGHIADYWNDQQARASGPLTSLAREQNEKWAAMSQDLANIYEGLEP